MSDGSSGDDRHPPHGEQELASKMLQVQSKRFYVDVKQNNRGRFIKLAEVSSRKLDQQVGLGGRKSRLILSMNAAVAFRDHLDKFVKFFDGLASGDEPIVSENGQLKSEIIVHESRRYYLSLKENQRGRYLRVSQRVSRSSSGPRLQIALPAPGMTQLRDALNELIDKYAEGYLNESDTNVELPEPKHVRAENNKIFYFDVGHNERGTFVRISEVKQISGSRSSIAVPMSSWGAFRDVLAELQEKMMATKGTENDTERTIKSDIKLEHNKE
ncbi:transcriptional activator protein Pur-alpha [Wuchereria bancrofti]|uniref:Transcriptional activator protein Pur-alpha n=1 Tax=Wuchereria bancrofti TaxID=6293 RepID=J9EMF7_WUCBA|nr:transcriptional activator protein Pur-alpha [Wuchereria bancrofti]